MNKVEKMHIADIIEQTNLFLTPTSLYEIWKMPSKALEQLEDDEFFDQIMCNEFLLYTFLLEHDSEIDKPKFIITLYKNYKDRLSKSGKMTLQPEEIKDIQDGLEGVMRLLKTIDQTFVYYCIDDQTLKVSHLTVMNSKEIVEGINRKNRNKNAERLEKIKKEIHFGNIIQSVLTADIQYSAAFDQDIGAELRYLIEYNTIVNENGIERDGINLNTPVERLASQMPRGKFLQEMIRALEMHIEEINIDRLLLCAAYRYIESVENGTIKKEEVDELKRRLEIIKRYIKKNAKVDIYPDITYSIRDLEQDLKRFVGSEQCITYLSKKQVEELKTALLNGEISLNSLSTAHFETLEMEPKSLRDILRNNPNNYIFFLKQEKCNYHKNMILKDIIAAQKCSSDLLELLCEKTDITADEIRDLFNREIISINDLKKVREQVGRIITDKALFEKYKQYRESKIENKEKARTQLERYALAYRNTEVAGKTAQEVQDRGEEFVTEIGEELETSDLIPLYGFDIIPLKVTVDWGGENIIEELLESESLKPADARFLRTEGLLDEKVLERLFKKCTQMSYAYQVSLVFAVFDGQTPEEQQIREQLAQYYHIENGAFKTSAKKSGKKRGPRETIDDITGAKVKMRDPGAKYNLLASIDKDVKIEEGIIDGHIIFHYPNIDGGRVLIEKLHKIKANRENGLIEIKADNESATYILSEEEFIKIKSQLIKEGRVARTELTQRWWTTRDPEHWIAHTGTSAWENAILARFEIDRENTRYSPEDLAKIEQLVAKSIESKKVEER